MVLLGWCSALIFPLQSNGPGGEGGGGGGTGGVSHTLCATPILPYFPLTEHIKPVNNYGLLQAGTSMC